jgi:hypothetical protein
MMEIVKPYKVQYRSWRRTLASGLTEYKSVTIVPDCTAEEYVDFRYGTYGMYCMCTACTQHAQPAAAVAVRMHGANGMLRSLLRVTGARLASVSDSEDLLHIC